MMGPRQAKKFFDDNRDALNELSKILKEAESVRSKEWGRYTPAERAAAIEMIETWIMQVWQIRREDFNLYLDDDDSLIRRLEKEDKEQSEDSY